MVARIVSLLIGYLFGCFQTAYIVGKVVEKIDIRNYGSGNSGTTNAIRVLGWKFGMVTFVADIVKAILPIILVNIIFDSPIVGIYAGFGVVIGHVWPVFLGFKGGKGIASTFGVMLAIDPGIALIMLVVGSIVVLISKYVSLGSITIVIIISICMFIFYRDTIEYIIIGLLITTITLFKHRSNIKRLLSGTENKLGHKKDAIRNKM